MPFFLMMTCILQIPKSYQLARRMSCILLLVLLTLCSTTSCGLRCCETPADMNIYHSISLPLCCIYLQTVPCDPAGADFNFAALSFNCEFLHQIHLIPLHPRSPAKKQWTFMVSARKNVARGLKEKSSEGRRNESDPYHNFPSRLPGDAL